MMGDVVELKWFREANGPLSGKNACPFTSWLWIVETMAEWIKRRGGI